jgi:hypothetical protein
VGLGIVSLEPPEAPKKDTGGQAAGGGMGGMDF